MPNHGSAMRAGRDSDARIRQGFADAKAEDGGVLHVAGVETLLRTHVVPVVARGHRTARAGPAATKSKIFSDREIFRFVDHAVAGNTKALTDQIALARQMDIPFEDIFLELLQPAARVLGDRWASDTCLFATVTLAMCQFHGLLRYYSPLFTSGATLTHSSHRVLLLPVTGEQHTFGLAMLGEFLRRDGHEVTLGPFDTARGLTAAVKRQSFTVIGFSLSCDTGIERLAAQIASVRRASKNRGVFILVGGQVFNEHPELLSRVGADWTARDAREVAALVRGLVRTVDHNQGGRI
jgi:methanogenic corrinoid protein MtbC1